MKVKVKKLDKLAKLPTYATDGSGCFDIYAMQCESSYAADEDGSVRIGGAPIVFGTGLAFEVPEGQVLLIFSRSGHGFNYDVRLANAVGVIDSDYRGELKVKLTPDSVAPSNRMHVYPGDRIAQGLILPFERVEFQEVEELSATRRGVGGFGHTGS